MYRPYRCCSLLAIAGGLLVPSLRHIAFSETSFGCFSFTVISELGSCYLEDKQRVKYDLYRRLAKLLLIEGKIHLLVALRLE